MSGLQLTVLDLILLVGSMIASGKDLYVTMFVFPPVYSYSSFYHVKLPSDSILQTRTNPLKRICWATDNCLFCLSPYHS